MQIESAAYPPELQIDRKAIRPYAAGWNEEYACLGLPDLTRQRFQTAFERSGNSRLCALAAAHCDGNPDRAVNFVAVFKKVLENSGLNFNDPQVGNQYNLHSLATKVSSNLEAYARALKVPWVTGLESYLSKATTAIADLDKNPTQRHVRNWLTREWRFILDPKAGGAQAEVAGLGWPATAALEVRERYSRLPEELKQSQRFTALAQAHCPDDKAAQVIFRHTLSAMLKAANLGEAERSQINLHPIATYVAGHLQELAEQVGDLPGERLARWKLFNTDAVFEDRATIINFSLGKGYSFSPEVVLAYLNGEEDFVWVTEQRREDKRLVERENIFRFEPGMKDRAVALGAFLFGCNEAEAKKMFTELVAERQKLRDASRQLSARALTLKNPYLTMPIPAHFQTEDEQLETALASLKTLAVQQGRWGRNEKPQQFSVAALLDNARARATELTVEDILQKAYHTAEFWLVTQEREVLDPWPVGEEMKELMWSRTFIEHKAVEWTLKLQGLHHNQEQMQWAWRQITKAYGKEGIPFTSRNIKKHSDLYVKALVLLRSEADQTATRLYDEHGGRVVDLSPNLDYFRYIVNDSVYMISVSDFQGRGFMDKNFVFTKQGKEHMAACTALMLTGGMPEGVFKLVGEDGRPRVARYKADSSYTSPIATFCICDEKHDPFDGLRSLYTFNGEQVFASVDRVKLVGKNKIFWDKHYTVFTHFSNDGVPGLRSEEELFEAWMEMRQALPQSEREAIKRVEAKDDPVEVIYGKDGNPQRLIVKTPVLAEERWLEKEALGSFETWYDHFYRQEILPLIDEIVGREYVEASSKEQERARAGLMAASRIQFYNVLAEAFSKSTFDDHSVSICVAPREKDRRLLIATMARNMATLGSTKKEKEEVFDRNEEKFVETGEFIFDPSQIDRIAFLIGAGLTSRDIQAGRHAASAVAAIASRIKPGTENFMAAVTAIVSPGLEESGSGGPSQISALRARNLEFLRRLFFITSRSYLHDLAEVGIVFGPEGTTAVRTFQHKITAEVLRQVKDDLVSSLPKGATITQEMVVKELKRRSLEDARNYIFHKGFVLTNLIFSVTSQKKAAHRQKRTEASNQLQNLRQLALALN